MIVTLSCRRTPASCPVDRDPRMVQAATDGDARIVRAGKSMNGSEMSTTTDFFDAIDRDDQAALDGLLAGRPDLAASRDDDGVSAVMHALYRGRRVMAERLAAALPALDIFEAAALGPADRGRALLA